MDGPVYTWGGIFGCFLLAVGFYGFFFGVVGLVVLISHHI